MNKLLIDTNALLRFLLKDIPEQTVVVRNKLKEAKKGNLEILVPQVVIFEISFALEKYYGFKKIDIVDKLKSILSTSYLKIQNRDIFKKAIEIYEANNISLVDCFLICYAEQRGADLFTFDRKLKDLEKN